jgi:hypothetical protein
MSAAAIQDTSGPIADAVVGSPNSLISLLLIKGSEKHSGDSRDQKECLLSATSGHFRIANALL